MYNLTPAALAEVKIQALKIYQLFEIITEYHNKDNSFPEHAVLMTLLQHFSFNPIDRHRYSHDEEVIKCNKILEVVQAMKEYHNDDNIFHSAYKELDLLMYGMYMSQDYMEEDLANIADRELEMKYQE